VFTLKAPAKINLTLEVLEKRKDGYHEITSIIQTISLADILEFQPAEKFVFHCDNSEWKAEKSLVSRAAILFASNTDARCGARINIQKKIPLSAGLGGESSAAAITLVGLNHLLHTELLPGDLYHLAEQLGSDVPFFLTGGTALVSGRGEKVSPLPSLPHHWVILLVPPEMETPGKTEKMYSLLKPIYFTSGLITDSFISSLTLGKMKTLPELYNVFDEVAGEMFERIEWHKEQFYLAGAKSVNMAGSGPVLFSLEEDESRAEQITQRLSERGLKAILTHTLDSNGHDFI
jgi:4-diphosphocytidyl-2-C-methyl-D-erythritol kinase